MKNKTIAGIYFYILSAASIALMVIGVFNTVNLGINLTQYDKYPLKYLNEKCDNYPFSGGKFSAPMQIPVSATPSSEEISRQKKLCEKQLEMDRKQQRLDDIKNSLTFLFIGLILFLIHFPQARKY